jgi:putative MATE family efflux protein
MAIPIAIGMIFQTLYFLIDLYFVGRLGGAAIAGVAAAGNVSFIVMGLTQVLAVGTGALVAQAVGRRDLADANLVFNQSIVMAAAFSVGTLLIGYAAGPLYVRGLGADIATATAGRTYLYWFLPALGLQFALVGMSASLRGTGIVKPTMFVQVLTVVCNTVLAPVLISGWGTGRALGVAGAGLATTLSIALGVAVLAWYFARLEHTVAVQRPMLAPRLREWRRILAVGLPAGGEFVLLFIFMAVIFWVIARFGAQAQAGFGVGQRVMQTMFLPVMAIAFAASPVAAQNYGAGLHARVRETFRFAAWVGAGLMLALCLFAHWRPDVMIGAFTHDPQAIAVGTEFLRYATLNYVATGLIFTCSGMFQAVGNTVPSLLASASRLVTFVVPAVLIARLPALQIHHVWWLSVVTTNLQAVLSLLLLRREFDRRLSDGTGTLAAA